MKVGKYNLRDIINPKRWWMVIIYYLHKWTSPLPDAHEEIVAYCEQVVFRRSQCPDCVEKGECIRCGCPINGLMLDPKAQDKDYLWGEMMKSEEWEAYKGKTGLYFNTSFNT